MTEGVEGKTADERRKGGKKKERGGEERREREREGEGVPTILHKNNLDCHLFHTLIVLLF